MKEADRRKKWTYGINRRLFTYFTLLLTGVILIMSISIEGIVSRNVNENMVRQYSNKTESVYNSFDREYETLDLLTERVILDDYVQNSLIQEQFSSYDRDMLKKAISYINNSMVSYYIYIDGYGRVYSQKSMGTTIEDTNIDMLSNTLGSEYSATQLLWVEDNVFGTGEKRLFVGRYVHNMDVVAEPGEIYFVLNEEFYQKIFEEHEKQGYTFILVSNQQEICYETSGQAPMSEETKKEILENVAKMTETSEDYKFISQGLICVRDHNESGFAIVTYASNESLTKMSREILWVILVIALLAFGAAVVTSVYLTNRLTKPIRYLSDKMVKFNKDSLSDRIEMHTDTELDDIGNSYNTMIELMGNLVEEVKATEKELQSSEMRSLMYQIHPHFLYNTLDNIHMLARLNNEPLIMKMIHSLTTYLRIILSNGEEEISIKRELQHAQAYLDIQKIRNENLFEYDIQCGQGLEHIKVEKLILQPIIENSIKHGFSEITEGGIIYITVLIEREKVLFRITNNGKPMGDKQNELNRLNEEVFMLDSKGNEERNGGYGIVNVVKRLKLKYGDSASLHYESNEEWTTCVIQIEKKVLENSMED